MTDRTQYCELCEAAQREISRLESVVYALNCESTSKTREIAELKAEPRASANEIRSAYLEGVKQGLGAIDEAIEWAERLCQPDVGLGEDPEIELSFVRLKLKSIRAKYAGEIVKEERGEK